jgi:hypothetical protein
LLKALQNKFPRGDQRHRKNDLLVAIGAWRSISGATIFCVVAARAQGQHRNARVSVRAIIFTVATVALPYV